MDIAASIRFALGKVDSADHRRRRWIGIVQGVITGIANRFIGVAVSLLSVPLTISYLGPERYGVWALVGSMLAWLRLADLGIGNGLNNAIAGAIGMDRPDLVRAHVSTAVAVLSGIAMALGLAVLAAWPWIDWNSLFGVKSAVAQAEVAPAMAAAIVFFLINFPMSVIGRVYTASQDGRLANYWGAAGNIASLVALLIVTKTHGGLVWLVIAISGAGMLVNIASGAWLFTRHKPDLAPRLRHVQRSSVKQLMGVGVQFFLIQIMALVVFQTDNLVVAHYLGASNVPSYSLTYSLFDFTSMIQVIMFNYVWAAYSEAIARRDIAWVERTFRLNLTFSLCSTAAAVLPLIFIARPFIRIWAGEAVVPPIDLVLWMGAWSMINAFCSPIACLLAAAAHMRAQLVYSAIAGVANVVLSIFLIQRWGVTGVIAGTVISYLVFVCGPVSVDISFLFRKLRNAV